LDQHPLSFAPGAIWFSEALLPSQFFARRRPDRRGEGYTHADAVIGHVVIGKSALANATLASSASQFIVTEAKLFSPLSPGVTNARYFDQAARNVACMAQVLAKSEQRLEQFSSLAFFVLAPSEQVDRGVFGNQLSKESIAEKVRRRISEYPPQDQARKEDWWHDWFLPALSRMKVECLRWEEVVDWIRLKDPSFGTDLSAFYTDCIRFNRVQEPDVSAPA
jgi:hypothetical protein